MAGVAEFSVPDTDLVRVQEWCRQRVPEHVRDKVAVDVMVSGRDVTVVERHAPWRPEAGAEWTTSPVARLRYLTSRGVWRLYWPDRDGRWHEYPDLAWARDVQELLHEIDRDPTAIFWG